MNRLWAGVKAFVTRPGEFRKAYTVVANILAELAASGLLHGTALHEVVVAIPILTLVGTVLWPNDDPVAGVHWVRKQLTYRRVQS